MKFNYALLLLTLSFDPVFADDLPLHDMKSPHGIEFSFMQSDVQSTVAVSVAFKYGIGSDPQEKPVSAFAACAMLMKGAGGKSSSELYESFQDYGGSFNVSPAEDTVNMEISAPLKGILNTAKLANFVLLNPDFPEKKLAFYREDFAKKIEEFSAYPEFKTQVLFSTTAIKKHPYSNANMPKAADVRNIQVADLKPWAEQHFHKVGIVVSVVGDITQTEAGAIVDGLLDGIAPNTPLLPSPPIVLEAHGDKPYVVEAETGDQVILTMGTVWTEPMDLKSNVAMDILTRIFGDGQKARVFKDVREATGATYGLQYSWNIYDHGAVNTISGRIAKAASEKTIAIVKSSWDRFRAEGPSPEEIADGKASLAQNFADMVRNHTWVANYVRDQLTGGSTIAEVAHIPSLAEKLDVTDPSYRKQFFAENPIIVITK